MVTPVNPDSSSAPADNESSAVTAAERQALQDIIADLQKYIAQLKIKEANLLSEIATLTAELPSLSGTALTQAQQQLHQDNEAVSGIQLVLSAEGDLLLVFQNELDKLEDVNNLKQL